MKILALIPARGGSKGIPRKNVRDIAGKPLIAWTIESALKSKILNSVVVSTDDSEISEISKKYGALVPFIRPNELSTDSTPGIEPVLHAVQVLPGYDVIVLLQPTSPLRSTEDIDNSIELLLTTTAKSVVSVTESKSHPAWMYEVDSSGRLLSFLQNRPAIRRQDLSTVYTLNGAVYVSYTENLVVERAFLGSSTLAYLMPPERSVDIDETLDFRIAELLLKDSN